MAFWTRTRQTETRSPSVATAQMAYRAPGLPQAQDWDAESAIRQGYLQNAVAFACAHTIAKAVTKAKLVWGSDADNPRDINPGARGAQLLGSARGSPCPGFTSRRLMHYWVLNRVILGRYASELELDAQGGIARIWPLVMPWLRPIPSNGGDAFWSGFEYGRGTSRKKLPTAQVFYAWIPSLYDIRQSEAPFQGARLDAQTAIMQDRATLGFYRNSMQPGGVLVYDEFATDEDEDAFQRQILARHAGPDNAGKVAFLAKPPGTAYAEGKAAVEWVQMGLSQRDARSIETYQSKIQNECIAMGVPMGMLDASGRTYDNSGVERRNFWENTVMPTCDEMADEMNLDLSPRLGSEMCWFNLDHIADLRPPSRFAQLNPVDVVAAGGASWPEIRPELGLPSALPAELQPQPDAGEADVIHTTVDRQALAAQTLIALGFDAESTLTAVGLPYIPQTSVPSPAPLPTAYAAEALGRRSKEWRAVDAQVTALEQSWERAWRRFFAKQERATLALLTGKRGRQMLRVAEPPTQIPDPSAIFTTAYWLDETGQFAADLYAAVVAAGAARVTDQFAIGFDLAAPHVEELIGARANQLAGQVTDTTYAAITDALSAGVAQGEGVPELAARVRGVFAEASAVRARTIARTEVLSAYNESAVTVAEGLQPGIVGGKEWIATQDGRTREAHAEADGQRVGLDEPFRVGGYSMRAPGDPSAPPDLTVNCRCTVGLRTPEEMRAGLIDVGEAERVLRLVAETAA